MTRCTHSTTKKPPEITFKKCCVSSTIIADSRRFTDTDGGWVPRADRPMQLHLGFQSATTARYFGFLEHAMRMNTTDVSTKEVVLKAQLAVAVADVYESFFSCAISRFTLAPSAVLQTFLMTRPMAGSPLWERSRAPQSLP